MELALFALAVLAALVGVATLYVQWGQYNLQRASENGQPGQQLNPREAEEILDEIPEDAVRGIAVRHIFIESAKQGVGYLEKQDIGVYLDLHSASCVPAERAVLAESLASFVRQVAGERRLRGASLASPREGNLLVGAGAAEILGVNFLMVRTGRAPRFGYPIEGTFAPGSTVFLVDDLCMEASFLSRCVRLLRKYGLNVSHCICLFERLDGNAREGLAGIGVELCSKYQIDDEELSRMIDQGISDGGGEEAGRP
ncbi:hypothetical protein AB0J52_13160 [Spirillospora sp. NPDC049652]